MDSKSPTDASPRPPAFIHLDCDGLWAVRSCYGAADLPDSAGDPLWLEGIPAALDLFAAADIRATLFVIGRDLEVESHGDLIRAAVAAGHEIANHSHSHRMDLGVAGFDTLRDEIERAQRVITEVAEVTPVGFRSPGFSFCDDVHRAAEACGLTYDSSVFPSRWGPTLRLARRLLGRGAARQLPYGGLRLGSHPRGPSEVAPSLVEVPVSVTPTLRLPAHASFALLRRDASFTRLLEWHAARALPLTWVIHLIDLCDTRALRLPTPRWSRGLFRQDGEAKRVRLKRMLAQITARFEVVRTDAWVRSEFNRA